MANYDVYIKSGNTSSGLSTQDRRDASSSRNARIELDLRRSASDSALDRREKTITRTETETNISHVLPVPFPVALVLRPNAMPTVLCLRCLDNRQTILTKYRGVSYFCGVILVTVTSYWIGKLTSDSP